MYFTKLIHNFYTHSQLESIHGIALGGIILVPGLVDNLAHAGEELVVRRKDPDRQRQLQTEEDQHADGVLQIGEPLVSKK